MTLSRLELDGLGSPAAIAERIHQLAPDLSSDFAIEPVCQALDIASIELTPTTAYEAALVMDANKAIGSILLAEHSRPRRRRFSIGHELGHFLIPTHMPHEGQGFACLLDDMRWADVSERNRHRRIEAEANRFAAHLLMPPKRIRSMLRSWEPDLAEIVRLAAEFKVSKEAMARGYIEAHRETLAVITARNGRVDRIYRSADFPWIEPAPGQPIPSGSIAAQIALAPGGLSQIEECDPETWIGERAVRHVEVLCEQVLGQSQGYAMVLLHAELGDDR